MPESILSMHTKPSLPCLQWRFTVTAENTPLLFHVNQHIYTAHREDEDDDIEKESEKTILIGASLILCAHTHTQVTTTFDLQNL